MESENEKSIGRDLVEAAANGAASAAGEGCIGCLLEGLSGASLIAFAIVAWVA